MSGKISSVVVYCASSAAVDRKYLDAASRMGKLLAREEITCINGAGRQGLMGALNDSLLRHGGKIKGIIPQFMVDAGWGHPGLTETIVTETMHERKQAMADASDAAIALPGGMGTLEELSEILTWKQLHLYEKPIVLLSLDGYYRPLLDFFDRMMREKFMNEAYGNLWAVAATPEEAVALIQNFPEYPIFVG